MSQRGRSIRGRGTSALIGRSPQSKNDQRLSNAREVPAAPLLVERRGRGRPPKFPKTASIPTLQRIAIVHNASEVPDASNEFANFSSSSSQLQPDLDPDNFFDDSIGRDYAAGVVADHEADFQEQEQEPELVEDDSQEHSKNDDGSGASGGNSSPKKRNRARSSVPATTNSLTEGPTEEAEFNRPGTSVTPSHRRGRGRAASSIHITPASLRRQEKAEDKNTPDVVGEQIEPPLKKQREQQEKEDPGMSTSAGANARPSRPRQPTRKILESRGEYVDTSPARKRRNRNSNSISSLAAQDSALGDGEQRVAEDVPDLADQTSTVHEEDKKPNSETLEFAREESDPPPPLLEAGDDEKSGPLPPTTTTKPANLSNHMPQPRSIEEYRQKDRKPSVEKGDADAANSSSPSQPSAAAAEEGEQIEQLTPSVSYERPSRKKTGRGYSARGGSAKYVTQDSTVMVTMPRRREGGVDLPDEHRPRQRARHVIRAGLVPNVSFDYQLKGIHDATPMNTEHHMMDEMEELDEEMLDQGSEYVVVEQQGAVGVRPGYQLQTATEHGMVIDEDEGGDGRVYHFENGPFIDDIAREEVIEEVGTSKDGDPSDKTRYVTVLDDQGMEVVYAVEEDHELEMQMEEEEFEHADVSNVAEQQEISDVEPLQNMNVRFENLGKEHRAARDKDIGAYDDEEDDMPPQLVAEEVQDDEVVRDQRPLGEMYGIVPGQTIRLNSPGGHMHEVQLARDDDGNEMFIDANGLVVELVTEGGAIVSTDAAIQEQDACPLMSEDHLRNIEFNFLDNRNICCGLCGEIVPYEALINDHLPTAHPEMLSSGLELEEVPYETWLRSRLRREVRNMQNGFKSRQFDEAEYPNLRLLSRGIRQLRKVSQIRVNPNDMTLPQLELALRRKMIEKLGRKVSVSLVDRLHARCGICQAVVSLNKKFEVVHLVRHFNAWHPSEHRCTGKWRNPGQENGTPKSLSLHDFAVVDVDGEQNNLQCIWCGIFLDRVAIGMHFTEVHPEEVDVPKCSLCLQEMIIAARLIEKYGEDFGVSLPDEYHVHSNRLQSTFNSEKHLDKAIERFVKRLDNNDEGQAEEVDEDEGIVEICTTNSRQSFGRRNKMKRSFVKPCFRQVCPKNSSYFEPVSACQWRCKLCQQDIFGAVISAGAIRHFKVCHPHEIENMQFELGKARLERISDGAMEFVHPQLVECIICNMTYALHKPYNICRAIRHLKLKHPETMPEHNGTPINTQSEANKQLRTPITLGEVIEDPIVLEKFRREYAVEFEKIQVLYGACKNEDPVYVLLGEDEVLDEEQARNVATAMINGEKTERTVVRHMPSSSPTRADEFEDGHEQEGIEGDEETFIEDSQTAKLKQMVDEKAAAIKQEVVDEHEEQEMRHVIDQHQVIEEHEMVPGQRMQYVYQTASGEELQMIHVGDDETGEYAIMEEEIIDGEHYDIDEPNVQYMTQEELEAAAQRGELQIAEEYVDENGEHHVAYQQYIEEDDEVLQNVQQ